MRTMWTGATVLIVVSVNGVLLSSVRICQCISWILFSTPLYRNFLILEKKEEKILQDCI